MNVIEWTFRIFHLKFRNSIFEQTNIQHDTFFEETSFLIENNLFIHVYPYIELVYLSLSPPDVSHQFIKLIWNEKIFWFQKRILKSNWIMNKTNLLNFMIHKKITTTWNYHILSSTRFFLITPFFHFYFQHTPTSQQFTISNCDKKHNQTILTTWSRTTKRTKTYTAAFRTNIYAAAKIELQIISIINRTR